MTEEVSLKEFLNSRIDEVKDSVKIAYNSMEKRLTGMNEFRDTLKDQAGRFVTREEMEAKMEGVQKDIQGLQKIVYTGIGVSLALQFLLKFFVT
jgi:hypothetical protein